MTFLIRKRALGPFLFALSLTAYMVSGLHAAPHSGKAAADGLPFGYGSVAEYHAAEERWRAIVRLPDPVKDKAFLDAADHGNLAMVKRLLAQGVPVNVTQENGWSALMLASRAGHNLVAKFLLDHGAKVNSRSGIQTETSTDALTLAAIWGNVPLMRMLIAHGADVNATDEMGNTILMLTTGDFDYSLTKRKTIAELLLHAGANLNAMNRSGKTALSLLEDGLRDPYLGPHKRPMVRFLKSLGTR